MQVLTCIRKVVKLSPTSGSTFENLFTHGSFTILLSLITPLISLAEANRCFLLKICNEPIVCFFSNIFPHFTQGLVETKNRAKRRAHHQSIQVLLLYVAEVEDNCLSKVNIWGGYKGQLEIRLILLIF